MLRKFVFGLFALLAMVSVAEAQNRAFPSTFAFGPNSGWVIVYEHGSNWGYRGERLPQEFSQMVEKMAANQYILGVDLNSTGWAVIGSRTMEVRNAPHAFVEAIRKQRENGYQILDVAFSDEGWVILTRKEGSHGWQVGGDVPKGLTDVMRRTSEEGGVVLGVGMGLDGGYAVTIRRPGERPTYAMYHCPIDAIRYTDDIDEM